MNRVLSLVMGITVFACVAAYNHTGQFVYLGTCALISSLCCAFARRARPTR